VLAEPLGDEVDRGFGLRLGALLHDVAKPVTLARRDDGSPTFVGHDSEGAQMSREILTRLRASEKLKAHVAGLARHHLRLGFLVHERPLARRALYRYLRATQPVEVDVTLLSVADRLATRGRKAQESIAKHVELAREVLPAALAWRSAGRRVPLVRGDALGRALGLADGRELGRLLAEIDEARYAGEIATPEDAVALAARLRAGGEAPPAGG
jgi:poly(A) polymerase